LRFLATPFYLRNRKPLIKKKRERKRIGKSAPGKGLV